MQQKILLISGKKQSGKDSACNFLTGFLLKKAGVIDKWKLNENGKLLIDIDVDDPTTGKKVKEWGLFDTNRKDQEYVKWASKEVWPHVKPEHFGDILKDVCQVVFGLQRENLHGTDEQKNEPTHIRWIDVYKLVPSLEEKHIIEGKEVGEFLTHRELLEVFGTDICRTLYNECWVQALFSNILLQGFPLVVICDCRFPHEVEYAHSVGAKVVRLTRNVYNGTHLAETALDDYTDFDKVIDNENMTQEEKGIELIKWLQSIGWV